MDPIYYAAPPKSSYNPNRRVSDLLAAQLKHFQHVELKNGVKIAPALARDVGTEAGAARYITEMTRAIRGQSTAPATGIAVVPGKAKKAKGGLTLAAAGAKKPRKGKKS